MEKFLYFVFYIFYLFMVIGVSKECAWLRCGLRIDTIIHLSTSLSRGVLGAGDLRLFGTAQPKYYQLSKSDILSNMFRSWTTCLGKILVWSRIWCDWIVRRTHIFAETSEWWLTQRFGFIRKISRFGPNITEVIFCKSFRQSCSMCKIVRKVPSLISWYQSKTNDL